MTGQTQLEKMQARNETLDKYEKSIGLPENKPPGSDIELEQYLAMDQTDIECMSQIDAIAVSVRLSQYAAYITRCLNKERASKLWADSEMNSMVCREIVSYDQMYMKHEIKVALICEGNAAIKELQRMSLLAAQRIERLSDIAASIKNIGYVVSLIHKLKKEENYEKES